MPDRSVTFLPDAVTVAVPDGETLLRAAHAAGVHVNSSCGGQGTCGKCRVRVVKGDAAGAPDVMLSAGGLRKGLPPRLPVPRDRPAARWRSRPNRGFTGASWTTPCPGSQPAGWRHAWPWMRFPRGSTGPSSRKS